METAYRVLAEQALELIAQQRVDGLVQYASSACRTLLGFEPGEVVGRDGVEFVHPDDAAMVRSALERVGSGALSASITLRARHASGHYVSLDVTLFPLRDGDKVSGIVTTARDATSRIAREAMQQANEQRIRALIDAVPGLIYQAVTGENGDPRSVRFTFVNDWPKQVLGLSTDLPDLASRLLGMLAPADAGNAWDALEEALRTDKPWVWHGSFELPAGAKVFVVGHAVPTRQADGSVLWSGVMLDDSARTRMQEALRRSEEQCRTVVAHMDAAHLRFDLAGALLTVNPASVRMLGYESDAALLAQNVADHVWLSPGRYRDVLSRVVEEGVASIELPLRRRDGTLRTVQGALRLLRDGKGTPYAVDAVLRDVTEELRARAELVQAREMAEAGSRAKSAFLANMSHEIRTPMNAIIGLSHLALQADPPPKQHEYLTQIHAAGVALLGIINDVLDVSKIEAGKLALEAAPFEIDAALSALSRVVAMRAAEKDLELVYSIDPRVPETLIGDGTRLGQVLTNLVSNAVKFTDTGEVTLTVDVVDPTAHKQGVLRLRFSVKDSGIGLTQEQQDRLFLPFSQVDDSTTRRHGGTGLGLAISQELVHIMGGHIEVRSKPGQGSLFFFDVPFGLAGPPAPPKRLPERRVLVVDDHAVVRDVLTQSLLALGCAVAAVPSGSAALVELEQARKRGAPYQVALIDARMPGMDGFTLMARIVESMPAAEHPAIMLMAVEPQEALLAGRTLAPARSVLRKPIGRDALYEAVRNARASGSLLPAAPPRPDATKERAQPLVGLHLLVVEDNEINQILARDLLEAAGAKVVIAGDGREAVRIATGAEPGFDVILMDVQMPGMDGHATTRVLRTEARTKTTPIIAMTAHAFDAERKKCLESGMNAHVAKPVNPPELLRTVLTWAQRQKQAGDVVVPAPADEPPPSHNPDHFDPTALRSVFRDPARQLSFLRKFVDSARITLSGLEPAWQSRSSEAINFAGHKLKSSAKACGAHALANVCAALELHAKDENWAELDALRLDAERLLEEVAGAVEDLERRSK
ncbi:MAG: response regulator [Polyangiales bacterium]